MDIFVIQKNDVNNISDNLLKEFEYNRHFLNVEKWREHCLAYLMLDRILKEVYKITDREIEFVNNKPFLKSRKKFFSLSHTEEYLVIAFSEYNCGVDIEKIKDRDYEKIAARMKFSSKTLEEFYYDWTKYEADYKLNDIPQSCKQFCIKDYAVTAVSENIHEIFEIYLQNGENFPNS